MDITLLCVTFAAGFFAGIATLLVVSACKLAARRRAIRAGTDAVYHRDCCAFVRLPVTPHVALQTRSTR